jgi:hypothetical protein
MAQLLYKLESLYHRAIPSWLFQPRYCWVYNLSLKCHPELNAGSFGTIRWAGDNDWALLKMGCKLTDRRLAEGDRAVILLVERKLIGVLWIATGEYRDWDTGLQIELEPNQAWMYGAWVHRQFRGKKLYSQMIQFVSGELLRAGQSEMLFAIDWSNGHSQYIHSSYGAVRVGKMFGIRMFGWERYHFQLDQSLK